MALPQLRFSGDEGAEIDLIPELSCPSCGASLAEDPRWETWRICPGCGRHFPLPAPERLRLLLDPGSFRETSAVLVSIDPLVWADAGTDASTSGSGTEGAAVVTGVGAIGGADLVVVALDHAFLGGQIGPVAGKKIALAFDLAAARRLPLVLLCAAGVPRCGSALALWQAPKMAAAAARLHRAGIPIVGVLAYPTASAVWSTLLTQADITLAEPGADVAFGPVQPGAPAPATDATLAEGSLASIGAIDRVVERPDLAPTLATLLALFADRGDFRAVARNRRSARPDAEPGETTPGTPLPAWERAALVRHPARPGAVALLERIVGDWIELGGDHLTGDDPAIVCGLGRLAGAPVAVIAQQREHAASAVGWRKAARLLRLAGHLELPVVALLDAQPEADAPPREGAARLAAIGALLGLAPLLPTPLIAAIVGESGGPGAAGLAAGDRTLMLEHAVLRAPGSERPGGGPFAHDRPGEPLLAAAPMLSSREAMRLGLVDQIVAEPEPGAQADPDRAASLLGEALAAALADLASVAPWRLLEERNRRIRSLGMTTPEGREAARHEILQWQEAQQTLARSLADLRERWQTWQSSGRRPLPSLPRRGETGRRES